MRYIEKRELCPLVEPTQPRKHETDYFFVKILISEKLCKFILVFVGRIISWTMALSFLASSLRIWSITTCLSAEISLHFAYRCLILFFYKLKLIDYVNNSLLSSCIVFIAMFLNIHLHFFDGMWETTSHKGSLCNFWMNNGKCVKLICKCWYL